MLGVGCLLGADIESAGLPLFILILALGMVACNAVGILAASFLVLFKRGEPVITIYGLAGSAPRWEPLRDQRAPGVDPLGELPRPARVRDQCGTVGTRLDAPPGGIGPVAACVALVVFSVVAFTLGLRLFHMTLQFARRSGVLST